MDSHQCESKNRVRQFWFVAAMSELPLSKSLLTPNCSECVHSVCVCINNTYGSKVDIRLLVDVISAS